MKKLLFLMLLFVFTANLASAQVYMSRGDMDDSTKAFNDFIAACDDYTATKSMDSRKEISKGFHRLASKMKSYNRLFTNDLNGAESIDPTTMRESGVDDQSVYSQFESVRMTQSELVKFKQHCENLLRLRQIFKDNSYRINLGDSEAMNNLEAFKSSAKVCLELQKSAYLRAYNERN